VVRGQDGCNETDSKLSESVKKYIVFLNYVGNGELSVVCRFPPAWGMKACASGRFHKLNMEV